MALQLSGQGGTSNNVLDGSVSERFTALATELDRVGRELSELAIRLSSVLKPIGPEVAAPGRVTGSDGRSEGPRRSPQCDLAGRLDAGVQVARDLTQQAASLLARLEL